jgi:hypothetical protein
MKSRFASLLVCLFACSLAFAQTSPEPTPAPSTNSTSFTISANVVSLPAGGITSAATDVGQTFAVTPNLFLRGDEILAPAVNLSGYFGGIQYALPTAKILAKTNLDPAHFQFYITGSGGQARVTVGANPVTTHFAALAGGGINYDPTGKGRFSVNLAEVRWAKFPGLSNSTVLVSSGLKIGF